MDTQPAANLEPWRLVRMEAFPQSILAAAVLYAKHTPRTPLSGSENAGLAVRIGDLLRPNAKKPLQTCFEEEWDAHMWLEAYRLLAQTSRGAPCPLEGFPLKRKLRPLVSDALEAAEFPWYNTPYIGTSRTTCPRGGSYLAFRRVFGNKDWRILDADFYIVSLPKSRPRRILG